MPNVLTGSAVNATSGRKVTFANVRTVGRGLPHEDLLAGLYPSGRKPAQYCTLRICCYCIFWQLHSCGILATVLQREVVSVDMLIRKYIFIVLGCICLGLGTAGAFLPILPTTPFYLLTVFFYANSSQKLHDWFLGTRLYHKHLDPFVKNRGMLRSTKISIICTVMLLMGFGFFMMARKGIWIPCVILAVIWVAHLLYFTLRVQTITIPGE